LVLHCSTQDEQYLWLPCRSNSTHPIMGLRVSYAAAAAAPTNGVVAAAPAGEQPQDADAVSLSPELKAFCGSMYNSMMSDLKGFMPAAFKRAALAAAGQLQQQVRGAAVPTCLIRLPSQQLGREVLAASNPAACGCMTWLASTWPGPVLSTGCLF
jgi:hypothetical protein